jgi:hypothetical protein
MVAMAATILARGGCATPWNRYFQRLSVIAYTVPEGQLALKGDYTFRPCGWVLSEMGMLPQLRNVSAAVSIFSIHIH